MYHNTVFLLLSTLYYIIINVSYTNMLILVFYSTLCGL